MTDGGVTEGQNAFEVMAGHRDCGIGWECSRLLGRHFDAWFWFGDREGGRLLKSWLLTGDLARGRRRLSEEAWGVGRKYVEDGQGRDENPAHQESPRVLPRLSLAGPLPLRALGHLKRRP